MTVLIIAVLTIVLMASRSAPITGRIELGALIQEHKTYIGKIETWYFKLTSIRRVNKPFGYGSLACIRVTTLNTLRQCSGTFALPRGKISVAGSFLYPVIYELAVTGGSDDYTGVGGTMDATRTTLNHYDLIFKLN